VCKPDAISRHPWQCFVSFAWTAPTCLLSYPLETGSLELLLPRLRLPSSESLSAVFVAVSPLLSGRLELSAPFSSAVPAEGSVL